MNNTTQTLQELQNERRKIIDRIDYWGKKWDECQDGAYRTIDITIDGVVYTESLLDYASETIHDYYVSLSYIDEKIEKNFPGALDT